ncbi:hypothetical protein CN192_30740 [Sinorhizobium medicae]|nr:hypothetical protein CN192_30740 [Sinorhizobium medicae]
MKEPLRPKDLVWLDSCDRHRNDVKEMSFNIAFRMRACTGMPQRMTAPVGRMPTFSPSPSQFMREVLFFRFADLKRP